MNFIGFTSLRSSCSLVTNFPTVKPIKHLNIEVFIRLFNTHHFYRSLTSASDSVYTHAHQLFDEIPQRNILQWNYLIKARANDGHHQEAVSLYYEMREYGISPDRYTFPSVLKACSSTSYLQHLKKIHEDIKRSRFEFNIHVQNALVIAYVKCRELDLARQVFDEMPERNVVSWTAIISGFANSSNVEDALLVFKLMLSSGERPNYITILGVIHAIAELGSEDLTGVVHGPIVKIGFETEISVVTALLGLYSLHEKMDSVYRLFENTPVKDLVLWSAMVAAYSRNDQSIEAIETFHKMRVLGVKPNQVSIVSVLPACANLGALFEGKQIHGLSITQGVFSDINLQNSLVTMYSRCGKPDVSFLVFGRIEKPDLVSWNAIISGLSENGYPEKALILFANMRSSPIEPDQTTIRNTIVACSVMEELLCGMGLHCYILKNGLSLFVSVGTALLKMYANFGEVKMAETLFHQLHYKDLVCWSAMLSVYVQTGHSNLALGVFKQMQIAGENPNAITLVSMLQACSSIGAQEHGESMHSYVIKIGCQLNVFLTSALIDLYCKFGCVDQAKYLFDQIPSKDLVCWSSMIAGYGMNGRGREALKTFSDMLDSGLKPNHIILISVLFACSHCGLVTEGWKWFYNMKDLFDLDPGLVHYACMVDLLSRRGMINEALEFINEMPLEPDAGVWAALLAGCRLSPPHDIEIAELAAKQLFKLDPNNSSYHVMLSNLYAECGRWGDVERLRKFVKKMGLRRTMGYSMVES